MFTPTESLLREAQSAGYAVGAFNVYNLEGALAVVHAAEVEGSPVLLQVHPKAIEHGGAALIALARAAADSAAAPMAVHLDHSTSAELIRMALRRGVSSVMADGSHLPYEENVSFTREMVAWAHEQDAAVEAELGRISGTEDGITVEQMAARMTDPDQAAVFVQETQVDALAVCIGNVHGPYPGEPRLDFERLERIARLVEQPLVLHGTSGLPDAMIRRAVELGVCKFNVNTELRMAYLDSLRMVREAGKDYDLLDVMQAAVKSMAEVVRAKMRLFGSSGKAVDS
jgi:tagatose 1,6-diphosphate aldolase GatY/KbaY